MEYGALSKYLKQNTTPTIKGMGRQRTAGNGKNETPAAHEGHFKKIRGKDPAWKGVKLLLMAENSPVKISNQSLHYLVLKTTY